MIQANKSSESSAAEITLRPITASDDALLLRIYASTRESELLMVPWSDEQKADFVRMQFAAQTESYRHYTGKEYSIVEVNGEAAGRLLLDVLTTEVRIVDITILPEWRGSGVGTALLEGVIARAKTSGVPVSIYVEQHNPAKRLYERLGFKVTGQSGVHDRMQHDAGQL